MVKDVIGEPLIGANVVEEKQHQCELSPTLMGSLRWKWTNPLLFGCELYRISGTGYSDKRRGDFHIRLKEDAIRWTDSGRYRIWEISRRQLIRDLLLF